jgi:hypothetical protein
MDAVDCALVNVLAGLVWMVVCCDPYTAYVYMHFFTSEGFIHGLIETVGLEYAPRLLSMLFSSSPPTIAFFKSLPSLGTKHWGVYALVLEK